MLSVVGSVEMLGATPPGPPPQLDEMNGVTSKIPAHHSMTFDMERVRLRKVSLRDQFRLGDASWFRLQTYAASAFTCSGVSCAPPSGGMGLRYSFGCDTPSVIVFAIPV
jgi:hypothetical protein